MGFNEEELVRINDATSGIFKAGVRKKIAGALAILSEKIDAANSLSPEACRAELIELLNIFTASRQLSLQQGASGYGHAGWAASAACESWLQELLGGNDQSIARVEALVRQLISRG